MTRAARGTTALLAIRVSGVLGACNREEPAPADDTTVETAPSLDVTDVALGRSIGADSRVVDEVGDFAPSDTIYAVVETSGTGTGTLVARWTFEDGQVVNEDSKTFQFDGRGTTNFQISKPDGWPVGRYRVEISLDGDVVQTRDFEVRA